jgi:transcriptional regulator with XRE-family HTH domain
MNRSISAAAGGRIHQLRVERGLSLSRLARMVGIQVSALERIEHGHARPSIALLDALARELDSSLVDLMKQARAKPPKLVDARAILDRLGREIAELPEAIGDKIEAAEAAAVKYGMHVCAGNQSAAARLLGLERKALVRRVEKTRGRR